MAGYFPFYWAGLEHIAYAALLAALLAAVLSVAVAGLFGFVSGLTRPRSGRVVLDGAGDLTRWSDTAIAGAGVRRKFQKPSVFMALTVGENLEIGAGTAGRIGGVAELIGLADQLGRTAGTLAHGQKQWLEIGMVLATRPRVLMLDEPVAGLTDAETDRTADLVRVLHEGRMLFEGAMTDARRDPRVIDVHLGR